MLFEFGFFWKLILLMILSWVSFGIWGFEFTVVTLLTAILAAIFKKNTYL
tara:strand:+ start:153 stop:302 length:150 start_codon:yes stop_codon:yes gene_type:complete